MIRRQTKQSIESFLQATNEFNLKPSEKLQIINICPTTLVEIYLVIESIEERFSPEKVQELLEIILRTLYVDEREREPDITGKVVMKERASKPKKISKHKQRGKGKLRS